MRSLVISIFLWACETWTLTAELERKIQATEMLCFWRLLSISYRYNVTNEEVRNCIRHAIGPYEDRITTVRKRKLRWYGHITCKDDPLGHGTRREKERQTEKEKWRQYIRMDRIKVGWSPSKGWRQRGMEKSGCPTTLDAPTVIQTTGWVSVRDENLRHCFWGIEWKQPICAFKVL